MTDLQQRWSHVMMDNYGAPPIQLERGSGARVKDVNGVDYVDMLAGIAVNALGHAHPDILNAVSAQIASLGHVSNIFAVEPVLKLAERLKERFASGDNTRVFFCNSGAEANEAAFKIARLSGRRRILAAEHGFHGRTLGALALTGQPAKRAPFEPLPGGVEFYPFGDVEALKDLVEHAPDDVAAIFLEPIQGETGVVPAPPGFLRSVRELCDEHSILMIVDEVQTGVGRTGAFFAFHHERVVPDVVTMAKGLGGGLPIGAVIARGAAAEAFTPGIHGTTFGGNPVAAAAANVVLDHVNDSLLARVNEVSTTLCDRFDALDGVSHVRGRGLMLGVVLEQDVAKQTVSEGLRRGVILNAPAPNVIRLTPPLNIADADIEDALTRCSAALSTALNDPGGTR